jgi:Mrp family chromosome partitioning ATPase
MGEIADALRRAREGRAVDEPGARSRPDELAAAARTAPEPLRRPEVASASQELWNAATGPPEPAELELVPLDPSAGPLLVEDTPGSEACRRLAVRLSDTMERRDVRSVAVVSSTTGEGKTTLACNLTLALASLRPGRDVALVDLDLRKPSLAQVFGLSPRIGIDHILRGAACLEEARIAIERPAFDIYPVVEPQRAAHELLVTSTFGEVLRQLEQRYHVVIFDTAPALAVPDVSLMLRHVGGCVPVARIGATRMRSLRQLMDVLPRDQILGPVLNGARLSPEMSYYYRESRAPVPTAANPTVDRKKWRLGRKRARKGSEA